MRRAEALRLLAEHRTEIDNFGVTSLAIFGSVARDEARPDSDVDILVEFGRPVGYFKLLDLQEHLSRILGRDVDLCTLGTLREEIRDDVLREAIRAA
jgi:predicted nucleotidyltransferase